MEIIHVVHGKLNASRISDINRMVNELATHQVNTGHRVALWRITRYTRHNYQRRVYTTQLFRAHHGSFRLDRQILLALDCIGPDTMFHLHGAFVPALYSLGMALRERNIPYVLTPHGGYNAAGNRREQWRKKLYFRFFERKLIDAAQAIHCLGGNEAVGLKRLHPRARTVVIPYGFESRPNYAMNPLPGNFVIGFCGHLDIQPKGLDLLLGAFAQFVQRVPRARLWIVGDSSERPLLEAQAERLGIADKTIFFGSRLGEEKLGLLRNMQVFIHPSRNEQLPPAVLEAASVGLPCVVTAATNLGEAIGRYKCGEVVAGPDQAGLYGALTRIHQRVLLDGGASIAAKARLMVQEAFNWNKIVDHFYKELYLHAQLNPAISPVSYP